MGLDDFLQGAATSSVLASIGLAAAAPFLMNGGSERGREAAKALIHKYLDMADKFGELSAEAKEQWQDLLAEVRAEREMQQQSSAEEIQEGTADRVQGDASGGDPES